MQQFTPFCTKCFPHTHLGQSAFHPCCHQPTQVKGWDEQQNQHLRKERHEYFFPRRKFFALRHHALGMRLYRTFEIVFPLIIADGMFMRNLVQFPPQVIDGTTFFQNHNRLIGTIVVGYEQLPETL